MGGIDQLDYAAHGQGGGNSQATPRSKALGPTAYALRFYWIEGEVTSRTGPKATGEGLSEKRGGTHRVVL